MNIHLFALALAIALAVPSAWVAGQDPAMDFEAVCGGFAERPGLDPTVGTVRCGAAFSSTGVF